MIYNISKNHKRFYKWLILIIFRKKVEKIDLCTINDLRNNLYVLE